MTRELVRSDPFNSDAFSMLASGWSSTVTGSGVIQDNPSAMRVSTGSSTGSTSLARGNPGATLLTGANGLLAGGRFTFTERLRVKFVIQQTTIDANTTLRFQIGEAYDKTTVSDLDQRGFGIKIINSDIYAQTHDGTSLTLSGSPIGTLVNAEKGTFTMDSDAAGDVSFYKNGTLMATQSGGPTTISVVNKSAINFSASNGAGTRFHQCFICGQVFFIYGN